MGLTTEQQMLVEQRLTNEMKSTPTAYLLWFFLGSFWGAQVLPRVSGLCRRSNSFDLGRSGSFYGRYRNTHDDSWGALGIN